MQRLEDVLADEYLERAAARTRAACVPASAAALGAYMGDDRSLYLRIQQRMSYLRTNEGGESPFRYDVYISVSGRTATISLKEMRCEIPLRVCDSNETTGIGPEDVKGALARMLGVSREQFDATVELCGFGEKANKNASNVLLVFGKKRAKKNNNAHCQTKTLNLQRSTLCDLCWRVGLAMYPVAVDVNGQKMNLRVCNKILCADPSVWVLGAEVLVTKNSHDRKAIANVSTAVVPAE